MFLMFFWIFCISIFFVRLCGIIALSH